MSTSIHHCDLELLAQADLLLLLADGLRPPLDARARLSDMQPPDVTGLLEAARLQESDELLPALLRFLNSARETAPDDWSDEYHRLFEGAMVCPLNETAFVRRDKGAIIGDLAGYYRAFGWTPADSGGEKPDHLITELEFLAVLLAMAAIAQRASDPPAALEVTRRAIDAFTADHLGDWIAAVCERIAMWTGLNLYRDVAEALHQTWRALATAHCWPDAATAAAANPAFPADDAESPLECGASEGGFQPQSAAFGASPPIPLTVKQTRPA